jgi:6,7-dimethyl-8-ribityllumazine synthase
MGNDKYTSFNLNKVPSNTPLAIITGRFNQPITEKLLEGALSALSSVGLSSDVIDRFWVPGAYEIPFLCQKLAKTGTYKGIITLGAVIRGDTPHFDYVAGECAKGIQQISLQYDLPIGFGILTTDNVEQAWMRCGVKGGNKGIETAMTVLEMIQIVDQIQQNR